MQISHDVLVISGGWNNNPTTAQFQSIFRRLLARCGLQPGTTGNITALDATVFVCGLPASSDSEENPDVVSPLSDEQHVFQQADYQYTSPLVKALVDNAVVYIAGWVVFKLLKTMECDDCRYSLVTSDVPNNVASGYHLLTLKSCGGLVVPSAGVVQVCQVAEKVLRQNVSMSCATNKVLTSILSQKVLKELGGVDVFCLGSHISDTQDGIDNHHFTLLRSTVTKYMTVRQHHIAKLHTLKLQGSNVRHKLTKTILFKGQ